MNKMFFRDFHLVDPTYLFDISDMIQDFIVELPLAGLSPDNLSVERLNEQIIIEAINIPDDGYVSKFKDFRKRYILTEKHDLDKINVTMSNGLLKIHVPILEAQKPKKYPIKIS